MNPSTTAPAPTVESLESQIKALDRAVAAHKATGRELDLIKAGSERLAAMQSGMVAGMVRAVELATGAKSGGRLPVAEDFGPHAADFAIGSMLGKVSGFMRAAQFAGGPAES